MIWKHHCLMCDARWTSAESHEPCRNPECDAMNVGPDLDFDMMVSNGPECSECGKKIWRGDLFWSKHVVSSSSVKHPVLSVPVCAKCAAPIILPLYDAYMERQRDGIPGRTRS